MKGGAGERSLRFFSISVTRATPLACCSRKPVISAFLSALPTENWSSFSPWKCVSLAEKGVFAFSASKWIGPVLARLEVLDLDLALDDQAQGRALHAAGREPAADLLPEERRKVEADEVVEGAARLLRVHELHRDVAGVLHRVLHGALGDLVEHHPLERLVLERALGLQDLGQVPGDGLAFAVRVRCEEDGVGVLDGLGDGIDVLRVAVDDLVLHAEVVVGIDGAGLRHEVADMAVGGQDLVVLAEVFLERLRLRGRLDDEQVGGHGSGISFFSFYNARIGGPFRPELRRSGYSKLPEEPAGKPFHAAGELEPGEFGGERGGRRAGARRERIDACRRMAQGLQHGVVAAFLDGGGFAGPAAGARSAPRARRRRIRRASRPA